VTLAWWIRSTRQKRSSVGYGGARSAQLLMNMPSRGVVSGVLDMHMVVAANDLPRPIGIRWERATLEARFSPVRGFT